MESIYPELALFGSKNECAMTDTVFFPLSEVSEGTVSFAARKNNYFELFFTYPLTGLHYILQVG